MDAAQQTDDIELGQQNNQDTDLGYEWTYYARGIVKATILFVLVGSIIWIKEMKYNPYWIALPLALTCLYLAYLYRDLREKLFDQIDSTSNYLEDVIVARNERLKKELKKEIVELREEVLIETRDQLSRIETKLDIIIPKITTVQDVDPMRQIAERSWSRND